MSTSAHCLGVLARVVTQSDDGSGDEAPRRSDPSTEYRTGDEWTRLSVRTALSFPFPVSPISLPSPRPMHSMRSRMCPPTSSFRLSLYPLR